MDKKLPPTVLVIFGITGDLSHRYLLPSLAQIAKLGQLPEDFKIIGISRRELNLNDLFTEEEQALKAHTEPLQMDLASLDSYQGLKNKLQELSSGMQTAPQVIYYFAIPPNAVPPIIKRLGEAGLNSKQSKLLLEKPFGVDLESARELIEQTAKDFPEEQVYRIDHYLAKEMAQNIIVFLGSNTLFRSVWSSEFIEKIEIDVAEKINIEGRAIFYESTGALRDIVQSHLLQLAALTLMEPCSGIFEFSELPSRRLAALKALRPLIDKKAVRAQYEGYQNEVNNPGSVVETFVSLTVESTDPRWSGVPIRLTTGKNLKEKSTAIKVYFKEVDESAANRLVLRIQPREGVEIDLWVKQPGYDRKLQKLPLQFNYEQHFKQRLPEAYEQVLIDAMRSNRSLFAGSEEVLASWSVIQPIQSRWEMNSGDLQLYKPGSTIEEVLNSAEF